MHKLRHLKESAARITSTGFFKQVNASMFLRIFFLASSFVIRVVLARSLGIDGLGIYNFALAWVELLVVFSAFGITRLAVREVAKAIQSKTWGLARGLIRFSSALPLMLSLLLMSIAIIVRLWSFDSNNATMDYDPTLVLQSMLFAFVLIPIRTLILIRQSVMQGLDYIVSSQVPEYLIQPLVLFAIIISGWWWLGNQFNAVHAIVILLLSNVIAYLIGEWMLRSQIPEQIASSQPVYDIRNWVAMAVPLLMIKGVNILRTRTDVIMLGLLSTAASVALYSTAFQLGNLVTLPLMVIGVVFAPKVSQLYKKQDMVGLQQMTTRTTQLGFLGAIVITVGLVVFANPLLGIFGKDFVASRIMLYVVIGGQLFSAMCGSVGTLLSMTDNTRFTLIGTVSSLIINLVLNALLIPQYGGEGAAIASLISMIIMNSILLIFVWKILKINPLPFHLPSTYRTSSP